METVPVGVRWKRQRFTATFKAVRVHNAGGRHAVHAGTFDGSGLTICSRRTTAPPLNSSVRTHEKCSARIRLSVLRHCRNTSVARPGIGGGAGR